MTQKIIKVSPQRKSTKKEKFVKNPKVKSKGWLETPADWARFDAWAEVNAQPRRIPEPEPKVRETRPLSQLKKRIEVLSLPTKKTDESEVYRLDLGVSKAALKAKPSKRIKKLAKFIFKETDACREIPIKIRKAALRYEPTVRIIEISRPLIRAQQKCKAIEVSQKALNHETTDRERIMASSKKTIECPDLLTDEEKDELMTPTGVMKSALTYEITPWIEHLSLPSYRSLKDRNDENAKAWKKKIIEELETRGKEALGEKSRNELRAKQGKRKMKSSQEFENGESESQNDESNSKKMKENDESKRRKIEKNAWRFTPNPFQEIEVKKSALKATASSRVKELSKANIHKSQAYWENPFEVSKSALSASASARILELSNPLNPRDPVEKSPPREKDKFGKPIIPMPAYGKILPEVKYKKPECKSDENENKTDQKELSKKKPLNPIVFESSIDPYLDPQRAKIQKNERRKLAQRENKSDSGVR